MTQTPGPDEEAPVPEPQSTDSQVESDGGSEQINGPPEDKALNQDDERKGPGWWQRFRHCWNWYLRRRRDWSHRNEPGLYDSKWNEASKLPHDEGVAVPAIWVTEIFTPSTSKELAAGINRLRWTQSRDDDQRVQKWMDDVRQGRMVGFTKMGHITAHSSSNLFADSTADLPDGVRAVSPTLTALTGSMTVMTAQFVLDDDTATSLDGTLRKDYQSTRIRRPGIPFAKMARYIIRGGPMWFPGYGRMTPDMGRRTDAQKDLAAIEVTCRKWVERYFPATFSGLSSAPMPTAALFITEKTLPLTKDARKIRAFKGIGIQRHHDAWTSSEWPGGRMALPSSWAGESKRLTFACRRRDAFAQNDHYHEPTSNWTLACRVDEYVQGFISRWAVTELLQAYKQELAIMRDGVAQQRRIRPIGDLKELRTQTQTLLADVRTIAREVGAFTKSEAKYNWSSIEWQSAGSGQGATIELLDEMRRIQDTLATAAASDSESFAQTALISNQLTHSISNIRMQRWVIFLSIVSLLVASIAAYLAYFANT